MDRLAHVKQRDDGTWDCHPLEAHLLCVSSIAGEFAAVFASREWGRLAGLWHDLGKYQLEFQEYIRSVSGFDAHIETAPGRVKYAIAGAMHAAETLTLSSIAGNEQVAQRVLAGSPGEPNLLYRCSHRRAINHAATYR
ncbi:MAG: CRISPR-associated endonuclease Cas3'' [Rhodocyclaceae bacterium]|nr:MAG: CRISPR-associated endonuclease Cas3'' [Rhodocyclaceae bacterium]